MKIDSKKIEEIIKKSSNVVITAHKNLDLDALGAILGFFYIASKLDKESYLLIEDDIFEEGVKTALNNIEKLGFNIPINKLSKTKIGKNTLLVILDTNNEDRIQNEKSINKINNKILIDHHVKGGVNENDYLYSYINSQESSSCEIIMDLLIDLNVYIPQYIASVMLSGIMVDTNRFYIKTTKNTFEVAALLKKMGADYNDIQYLFKQDFNEYIKRQEIIKSSVFVNKNVIIAIAEDNKIYDNEELAKAADTMLTFNFVEASFVIGKIDKNQIGISARSLEKIDVQSIMKKLNGGGHKTEAATQIIDKNIDEVKEMVIKLILK